MAILQNKKLTPIVLKTKSTEKSDPYTIEGTILLTKKVTPIDMGANVGNLPPDIINLNIYVIKKHLQYVREENIGISKIITEECNKKLTPYI